MKKVLFSIICLTFFLTGCTKNSEKVETPIEPAQEMLNETVAEVPASSSVTTASAATSEASIESVAAPSVTLANAMIPDKPTNEDIQKALKNAGFYDGKVDGTIGPKSKKAIEDFQAKNNLTVDGKVGPKTWEKLKQYLVAAVTSTTEAAPVQQ